MNTFFPKLFNSFIAIILAIVLILPMGVGCNNSTNTTTTNPSPVPQQLFIGMPRVEAEKSLALAGAKEELLDALGPASSDALEDGAFYTILSGELLEIGYQRATSSEDYVVYMLSICRNPDAGKLDRVFEQVQQLDI